MKRDRVSVSTEKLCPISCAVFHDTAIAKLCHASPAWWGFTSAADRNRLEAFLRRSTQFGYRDASAQTLSDICEQADKRLFDNIIRNDNIHSFRLNAVSIIHFGSDTTTTKSLCAPRLSMTVILLQEYCSRHTYRAIDDETLILYFYDLISTTKF